MFASFSKPPAATVLVVDDEPFIRTVVARALDEINYFTIEAENAEVALDLLHADPGIGLLITDIHLHGALDGHQLVLKAYSIIPALKVIYMTGDFVAAARLGKQPGPADGVLVKPFRLEDLWQMVEGCLKTA
ncbi:response regulator [Pseudoroseomonas wenyumeiae]|uniref:Response regulator n=1 Tax=Teichococcus wenyumeiae TaxID=2478470 RepID=A0A3A9JDX3_9PROT|nr:response regulator [Pseudoroseomonas wenyumeiae]RKK02765.1 response regulator [Pseudoroseomonas wenyumeiae]RMI19862.1 response regulator [Pseudoroseomonas wenyumeiae]